jgi:hypothetical protein
MCFSNRADQHAHFPGRGAASIRLALNYDHSQYTIPSDSLQTLQSRLQQDLFELAAAGGCSSLRLCCCSCCSNCCHFCPLQMPLVRRSHKFGITVLVHLEATGKEGRWHYGWAAGVLWMTSSGRWHYGWAAGVLWMTSSMDAIQEGGPLAL